jgi:hypothetical protein
MQRYAGRQRQLREWHADQCGLGDEHADVVERRAVLDDVALLQFAVLLGGRVDRLRMLSLRLAPTLM